MTSEELERAMQFILKQHAQLASKVDALAVKVDGLADVQRRAGERWERAETSVRALLAITESHEGEITAMREAMRESRAVLDRQMAKTDERINALIAVLEHHVSDGHGGQK